MEGGFLTPGQWRGGRRNRWAEKLNSLGEERRGRGSRREDELSKLTVVAPSQSMHHKMDHCTTTKRKHYTKSGLDR